MNELTTLGVFHIVVSVLAFVLGVVCLIREKFITSRSIIGLGYVITLLLSGVTAFGIFRTGSFSPGHILTIAALVSLAVAFAAERFGLFGSRAEEVGLIAYAFSFFTVLVFTVTETLTRLPPENPLASSQDTPLVLGARAVGFFFFVWQVRSIRAFLAQKRAISNDNAG